MIEYLIKDPDIRLTPYIKGYFWGKDEEAPLRQRIVPNGEMGLCIYRNCSVEYDGFGEMKSCISGQRTNYTDIKSHGRIENIAVNFTTLGAHLFFEIPLQEYKDQYLQLDTVEEKGYSNLKRDIENAENAEECFKILDQFFLEKLERINPDEENFRRIRRAISYGSINQEIRIADLAEKACLSERHFNRIFSSIIGMSPKDYLRIRRYQQTVNDIKKRRNIETITEIAIENGYCDYSHLSAEFKKISGYSPTELLNISENDEDKIGWRI